MEGPTFLAVRPIGGLGTVQHVTLAAIEAREMARACERAGANVISQVRYRLGHDSPGGFTAMCLLDESHISAHTYADAGLIALDVFTCGDTDPKRIWDGIQRILNLDHTSNATIQGGAMVNQDNDGFSGVDDFAAGAADQAVIVEATSVTAKSFRYGSGDRGQARRNGRP